VDFPSMRARDLLRVLKRKPLSYSASTQEGSHRKMTSAAGYPDLLFSFHERQTLAPGLVRKIMVKDVGLTPEQAIGLLR
jgi:predicted RNA binding protein YcfA (HicA-like mRNA interferase family)